MDIEFIHKKISPFSIHWSRQHQALAITLLLYIIGIAGLLFGNFNFFIQATPLILLLNLLLLVWTEEKKNGHFFIFLALCFVLGMIAEVVGVNTGKVFGQYVYGDKLGPKIMNVPLLMGMNWFVLVYCAGMTVNWIINRLESGRNKNTVRARFIIPIIVGATITTFFDWMMEPAARRLGYWAWPGQENVPLFNYFCWFLLSGYCLHSSGFWLAAGLMYSLSGYYSSKRCFF